MAKNSAVQYEVVAVDDEDGVQWRRWHRRQQPSTASKTKARQWRGKDGVCRQRRGGDGREGGSSVGVDVGVGIGVSVSGGGGSGGRGGSSRGGRRR